MVDELMSEIALIQSEIEAEKFDLAECLKAGDEIGIVLCHKALRSLEEDLAEAHQLLRQTRTNPNAKANKTEQKGILRLGW